MSKKGYLLMEVSVAIAIVAIALVVIVRSFSTALRSSDLGLDYTRAALLLEENLWGLEETALREDGLPEDLTESGQVGDYKWSLSREKIEETDLEEVTLSVSWEKRRRKENTIAATYFKEKGE